MSIAEPYYRMHCGKQDLASAASLPALAKNARTGHPAPGYDSRDFSVSFGAAAMRRWPVGQEIFLSVGKTSTPMQEAFVTAIERHLQVNGLFPKTVGRSAFSSDQPLKLVSDLMKECSGTVIVAFERTYIESGIERRGSSDEKTFSKMPLPTVWNQIEAAMAYTHGHPLLVIVEDGLKGEGLLEKGYDWYVQSCKLDGSVLAGPEFVGVFADWKRRVETHSVHASTTDSEKSTPTSPEALTLGDILKALTVTQLWAIISGLGALLVAVATTAFKLGQSAGLTK
jgi:hypothetical protein